MCCLSEIAIDQGKVLLFKASSLKNQGYPAKISSEHSPDKHTVAYFFIFLQKSRKEESTSAIPGKSLAIIASSRVSASSGVSITI